MLHTLVVQLAALQTAKRNIITIIADAEVLRLAM
jgi:hypothetical protein